MLKKIQIPKELIPSDPRFGVGPSLIPLESVQKLANTGHSLLGNSHRKASVKNLVKEVQEGVKAYFNLPSGYEVILGNGGATFLWDMIGLGLVENSSYHFVCGEFSDKWYQAHKNIPWLNVQQKRVEFGNGLNPTEEPGYDFLACTLNETSTGVQLNNIPKLINPNTLMGVDATSGAGQIKADFNNIDVYYFSPQKVFASDGGLYLAILSPKAIARAEQVAKNGVRYVPESMKWKHAIENSKGNQTYNTPAVATLFLLNEQLKLMNLLGQDSVVSEAKRKAAMVYGWAESKPYLNPYVEDASFRSEAVATIDIDPKFNADDITKILREQNVAFDIDGYRKLNRNQLRISMFHNVTYENLEKLTKAISLLIENEG